MKDNVVYVDFSSKHKRSHKNKGLFLSLLAKLKKFFHISENSSKDKNIIYKAKTML